MAGELQSIVIADTAAIDPQSGIGPSGSGWVAQCVLAGITNTAGTLAASKLVIQVSDPGYTANGATTTVNRTVRGTTYLRRNYPNGNDRMITTDAVDLTLYVALDDVIYSGTTIVSAEIESGFYDGAVAGAAGSITNSSTETYKKPIGAWGNFNGGEYATTNSILVEFCAFSNVARNNQQVACVEFYADDGTTTGSSVFANSPTLSSLATQGNIHECFSANVDLTGQNQAALTKINAKLYPWIGDSSAIMDLDSDGYAWPTALPLTPLRVFCDSSGSYGGAYAYVDGVGAGTPQVSADPATAKANPYSSLAAALAAVKVWNNANKGHDDFGGSVVRFINDTGGEVTYDLADHTGNFAGAGRHIVELDPDAAGSVALLGVVQRQHADNCVWRNLTIRSVTGGTNYMVLGYSSGGTPATSVFFDGVTFDNPRNVAALAWYSFRHLRNVSFTGGKSDLRSLGPTDSAVASMFGCSADSDATTPTFSGGSLSPLVLVGSVFPYASVSNTVSQFGDHGRIIYNNRLAAMLFRNTSANTLDFGVANVQNLVEYMPSASVICMNMFADSDLTQIDNYIDFHNTAVGERSSRMYNDVVATQIIPNGLIKKGISKFSLYDNYNIKDERFGPGQGSVGNWRYSYSVGNVGNVAIFGNTRRLAIELPENDATDQYLGSYWLDSSSPNLLAEGHTQTELMDMFENWTTTPRAVPAVGGDYHLTAAATPMLNRVPPDMAVLAFDLDGEPRSNSGSGAAGAYEFGGSPEEVTQSLATASVSAPAQSFSINSYEVVQSVSGVSVVAPAQSFSVNDPQLEFTQELSEVLTLSPAHSLSFGLPPIEFNQTLTEVSVSAPRHSLVIGDAVRVSTFTVTWA